MVEGQALGNDLWRVVGAVLERGAHEQPAHEFGIGTRSLAGRGGTLAAAV
jgi:hypothetical protein